MKRIFHVQVTGDATQARLQEVGEHFAKLVHDGDVITTSPDFTAYMFEVPDEATIDGVQVVPRATLHDIAKVVYSVTAIFRGFGNIDIKPFEEQTNELRAAMLTLTNCVLRGINTPAALHENFVAFLKAEKYAPAPYDSFTIKKSSLLVPFEQITTRQVTEYALVIGTVNSMFSLLPAPNPNTRDILLLTDFDKRTWEKANFRDVKRGNVFKLEENEDMFHVTSDLYVNYLQGGTWSVDVQPFAFPVPQVVGEDIDDDPHFPDLTGDDLV